MTADEVSWCLTRIWNEIDRGIAEGFAPYHCSDNFRAARLWVSSQRRRYTRLKEAGCCGSADWIELRWSWEKLRFDKYLLGFNYGH